MAQTRRHAQHLHTTTFNTFHLYDDPEEKTVTLPDGKVVPDLPKQVVCLQPMCNNVIQIMDFERVEDTNYPLTMYGGFINLFFPSVQLSFSKIAQPSTKFNLIVLTATLHAQNMQLLAPPNIPESGALAHNTMNVLRGLYIPVICSKPPILSNVGIHTSIKHSMNTWQIHQDFTLWNQLQRRHHGDKLMDEPLNQMTTRHEKHDSSVLNLKEENKEGYSSTTSLTIYTHGKAHSNGTTIGSDVPFYKTIVPLAAMYKEGLQIDPTVRLYVLSHLNNFKTSVRTSNKKNKKEKSPAGTATNAAALEESVWDNCSRERGIPVYMQPVVNPLHMRLHRCAEDSTRKRGAQDDGPMEDDRPPQKRRMLEHFGGFIEHQFGRRKTMQRDQQWHQEHLPQVSTPFGQQVKTVLTRKGRHQARCIVPRYFGHQQPNVMRSSKVDSMENLPKLYALIDDVLHHRMARHRSDIIAFAKKYNLPAPSSLQSSSSSSINTFSRVHMNNHRLRRLDEYQM